MRRSGAMGSRHASDRAQIKSRYGNVCLCALAPARMMLPPSAPAAFRVVADAADQWPGRAWPGGRYDVADDLDRAAGSHASHGAGTGPHSLGRRDFLRYTGMGAVADGGETALAACGSSTTPWSTSSSAAAAGEPKERGMQRAGVTGGTGAK